MALHTSSQDGGCFCIKLPFSSLWTWREKKKKKVKSHYIKQFFWVEKKGGESWKIARGRRLEGRKILKRDGDGELGSAGQQKRQSRKLGRQQATYISRKPHVKCAATHITQPIRLVCCELWVVTACVVSCTSACGCIYDYAALLFFFFYHFILHISFLLIKVL